MRGPLIFGLAASLAMSAGAMTVAPPASAQMSVTHADSSDPKFGDVLPADSAGAIDRARKLVADGKLPDAIRTLAGFVADHPKAVGPARYLGDLYYRSGDKPAAEQTYLNIFRFYGNDRQTHDRLGGLYSAEDRIPEAIVQFTLSLPESGAYGHLVDLHRRLGDLDAFNREFRTAAESNPSDAGAQYAFGTILRDELEPDEALAYLQRARLLDGSSCPILAELGSALIDVSRIVDAESALQTCLKVDPDDYPALVNLGDAQIAGGDVVSATESFKHANRVEPDGAEALVNLGTIQDLSDHWQDAVAYYLHAISADPLSREAYFDLGFDYDEHRFYSLAEAAFLKGLSVAPDDGRLHYMLGQTYAGQGKSDLARAEFKRATSCPEPEVAKAATRILRALQ